MARYDLHLQPLAPAVQRTLRRPVGFGYKPAIAVRGFQVLMDQWMRIFLTPKGSDPCDLEFGTIFSDLVGSTVSPENAVETIRNCVEDCNAQMRAIQSKQLRKPLDEMLEDAQITRSVADPTGPGVAVWVRITNRAGASHIVLLPSLVALSEQA